MVKYSVELIRKCVENKIKLYLDKNDLKHYYAIFINNGVIDFRISYTEYNPDNIVCCCKQNFGNENLNTHVIVSHKELDELIMKQRSNKIKNILNE
jgi:hypothetical protein